MILILDLSEVPRMGGILGGARGGDRLRELEVLKLLFSAIV
ncbi:hypothetical protein [Picosynechococcus sp. PCC 7003]|nr:hypothetical protein [Picosynechococcus sp. PCC 7003]